MARIVPRGTFAPLKHTSFRQEPSLSMATRYLTPLSQISEDEELKLTELIDPHEHLLTMMGTDMGYSIDNEVLYGIEETPGYVAQ